MILYFWSINAPSPGNSSQVMLDFFNAFRNAFSEESHNSSLPNLFSGLSPILISIELNENFHKLLLLEYGIVKLLFQFDF